MRKQLLPEAVDERLQRAVVVGVDTAQRTHLTVKIAQPLFCNAALNDSSDPLRPDSREAKHDLNDIAAKRVRNRRTARTHTPEEVLNLRRERVRLGNDLKEFRVLGHVAGLRYGPAREHPRPLFDVMDLERRRREEEVAIELKREEPHGREEPRRDCPTLRLQRRGLRPAHLPLLLTVLLHRQPRHPQHGCPIPAKERQYSFLGDVESLVRVESGYHRRAGGICDRRGDPPPRCKPLTFRWCPDWDRR